MQPAHRKGFRFAFLPGQLFAFNQIERRVDDVKRLARLQVVQLKLSSGSKPVNRCGRRVFRFREAARKARISRVR